MFCVWGGSLPPEHHSLPQTPPVPWQQSSSFAAGCRMPFCDCCMVIIVACSRQLMCSMPCRDMNENRSCSVPGVWPRWLVGLSWNSCSQPVRFHIFTCCYGIWIGYYALATSLLRTPVTRMTHNSNRACRHFVSDWSSSYQAVSLVCANWLIFSTQCRLRPGVYRKPPICLIIKR